MTMIDDDLLMAFADGELDEVTQARVERAIAADPELAARLEVQRRLRARLAAHYAPVMDEEVPAGLRAMLETDVVAIGAARARRARPAWQTALALAATLVLGLVLGRSLWLPDAGPVGVANGTMVARGELARALDTQLASDQAAGAATRIGVTFAATDGRLCRAFDSAAVAGLACHGDAGWQLMMTAPGAVPAGGELRQAASTGTLMMQAAQDLMAGEPLDANAERRARDSGWRHR
jgi:hypothetical protein